MPDRRFAGFVLCLVLAGCSSRPSGDVALAKATLDKAAAAGAETYAADSMKAARQSQAALDAELKVQAGKWIKTYDKARDLAIAEQPAGDKAAAEAEVKAAANRAKALAAAAAPDSNASTAPNLFQNGDFTSGLQGWTMHPESDATLSVDVTPGPPAWHVNYRKGNWAVIQQTQSLQPDTVYVYEVTIKSTAPVVALYWQAEIGRFHEIDKTYPEWTHLRYVFQTPHWTGQPYPTSFHPILMKGAGEAWLKDLRLSVFNARS
jgi:hypothetical protein